MSFCQLDTGNSAVVKPSPHYPKFKGSNPATNGDQAWAIQINGTIDGMVILVPSKLHFLFWSNYLTIFGQTFPSNLFSQSFTDEKDGKVKNRQT